MKNKINIAIVGATGMVGSAILAILEERGFPIDKIYLLASQRSVGESITFNKKKVVIEALNAFDFSQAQIAFFAASNAISAEYAPKAAAVGCVAIDKSSHFRYDVDVPLIVPEVNGRLLSNVHKKNIIASPNCSTIPIVMALKPILDAVGITRVNVVTYQSVSGSGKDAVVELAEQSAKLLNGKSIRAKVYPQQIAFNVLPHIDEFLENGYTKEEMKVVWETQKIFEDDKISINPTAVRVPVFYGHSAALHIETKKKITVKQVISLLSKTRGVTVCTGRFPYPTPAKDASGKDDVFVGRIREDISINKGINLWVVSDNIRKGAALNAIQIAEMLLERYL